MYHKATDILRKCTYQKAALEVLNRRKWRFCLFVCLKEMEMTLTYPEERPKSIIRKGLTWNPKGKRIEKYPEHYGKVS